MGILMTIVAVMLGCGVFLFVECFRKTKRTGQIVATVILALATIGFGFLWIMLAVVGAFQQLSYDMRHGQAEFDLPMVVYYSPWFIIGLWIVNLIVFLITDNSIHDAAAKGNIEAVKQAIAGGVITGGAQVNARNEDGNTPLDLAIMAGTPEVSDLLRKHDGKTGEELEAEDK